jgi:SAM-dependent methyltransferase
VPAIDEAHDAFGRSLVDHLEGRSGPELMLEADDGSIRTADLQPEDFFLEHDAWPAWERAAIAHATGAVLDLGAGAGRHAVHLQLAGHAVTAVDASPGAVTVCRARRIADVRLADLSDHAFEERWDTILLMGGNLGLGGDWDPSRELLRRLAGMASPGGLLIGDSVDPLSDDPEDLAYEERNRASGFHRGHVALRLHYGSHVTPWWHQLNIPPDDLDGLVSGTGWAVDERMGDTEGYAVLLRRL